MAKTLGCISALLLPLFLLALCLLVIETEARSRFSQLEGGGGQEAKQPQVEENGAIIAIENDNGRGDVSGGAMGDDEEKEDEDFEEQHEGEHSDAIDSAENKYDGTAEGKYDGSAEGKYDGSAEGKYDGSAESKYDGSAESKYDGTAEGKYDGSAEGKYDGSAEGKYDGSAESKYDGSAEGKYDGSAEGKYDGSAEGKYDGSAEGKYDGGAKTAEVCPPGWLNFQDKVCFYGIEEHRKPFYSGVPMCAQLHANFTSIHSMDEFRFITGHFDLHNLWIGIARGNFRFEDGTAVDQALAKEFDPLVPWETPSVPKGFICRRKAFDGIGPVDESNEQKHSGEEAEADSHEYSDSSAWLEEQQDGS